MTLLRKKERLAASKYCPTKQKMKEEFSNTLSHDPRTMIVTPIIYPVLTPHLAIINEDGRDENMGTMKKPDANH